MCMPAATETCTAARTAPGKSTTTDPGVRQKDQRPATGPALLIPVDQGRPGAGPPSVPIQRDNSIATAPRGPKARPERAISAPPGGAIALPGAIDRAAEPGPVECAPVADADGRPESHRATHEHATHRTGRF